MTVLVKFQIEMGFFIELQGNFKIVDDVMSTIIWFWYRSVRRSRPKKKNKKKNKTKQKRKQIQKQNKNVHARERWKNARIVSMNPAKKKIITPYVVTVREIRNVSSFQSVSPAFRDSKNEMWPRRTNW